MFHVFLYKLHYDICHNIIQYAVSFLPTLNQFFFASAVWLDEIQLLLPLTSDFNLKKWQISYTPCGVIFREKYSVF